MTANAASAALPSENLFALLRTRKALQANWRCDYGADDPKEREIDAGKFSPKNSLF